MAGCVQTNPADKDSAPTTPVATEIPQAASKMHSVQIAGQQLAYRASWTPLALRNEQQQVIASISGISYVVETEALRPRPVIFFFNGGPGSSSSPMHGALNPTVQDSFATHLLADADLVFVDPVGTGYSRNFGETTPFWSREGDAQAARDFIAHWLAEHDREGSPLFVAGASYGSFRLAMMMPELQKLGVAGAIFVSPAIDFSGSAAEVTNNRTFVQQLPTMAIAAWHHQVANQQFESIDAVYEHARAFAEGDYFNLLLAGNRASAAERQTVAEQMSQLTGISTDLLLQHDLRLPKQVFLENAVPDLLLGRLDTRVTRPAAAPSPNSDRPAAANDPSLGLGKSNKIISSKWKDYLAEHIGVQTELDYYSLNLDLNFAWEWRAAENSPRFVVNPLHRVLEVMQADKRFAAFVIGGLYDLTTPVAGSEYLFTRNGFDPERVEFAFLPAAHAPFDDAEYRDGLVDQLREFVAARLQADAEFAVVQNEESVGSLHVFQSTSDRAEVVYQVDQNGRGAKLRALLRFDEQGFPIDWRIHGTSLMGGDVAEHYSYADGVASWQSQADAGQEQSSSALLYATNDGTPWELGLYARLLLADDDQQLEVLPAGQMRLERIQSVTVATDAEPLVLTIYKLSGLNLEPEFIMLDAEQRLFAVNGGHSSMVVQADYEHLVGELSEHFEAARDQSIAMMQQGLAEVPAQPVHIENVRVLNVREGRLSAPSVVVVQGETITAIKPFAGYQRPAEVRAIDGKGGVAVPGLFDMHAHTSDISGLYYLAAGVTGTRDMGNHNAWLQEHLAQQQRGEVIGPHIYPLGFIEGRSPYNAELGIVADSLDEALAAVDWYAERGYPGVKLYNSIHRDWLQQLVAHAKSLGLQVAGHVPAFVSPDEAITWGYDDIAHLNQLVLGWLLEEGEDTRTTLRLTAMQRTHALDLNSEPVQRTIALMQEHGVAQETTLVILERLMASRAGAVPPGDVDYLDHTPIGYQRYRKRTFVRLPDAETDQAYIDSVASLLEITKLLHDSGVTILPGTDAQDGFTLHREVELYTLAGISNAEALRIATLGSAEYLGWGDTTGSIETGKRADFFLIDGNPLADIKAIKQPRLVLKSGQLYQPREIYRTLGITPFN